MFFTGLCRMAWCRRMTAYCNQHIQSNRLNWQDINSYCGTEPPQTAKNILA
jgi:hypothetical protein